MKVRTRRGRVFNEEILFPRVSLGNDFETYLNFEPSSSGYVGLARNCIFLWEVGGRVILGRALLSLNQ